MLGMISAAVLLLSFGAAQQAQTGLGHLGHGSELMRAERYNEAAKEFELALRENGQLDEARLNLAICDFQLRDYDAATTLLSALLKSEKDARTATYYLGRIDLLQDNIDGAIQRFQSLDHGPEVQDEK